MAPLTPTLDPAAVVEFGGGRKGAFLLLRYVFIIAACYLLVFERPAGSPAMVSTGVMVAAALASNVALSIVSSRHLFAWYVEAPVLVADAVWVSWALHSTGALGGEFFLLYLFVLFVAASGRHLPVALFGGAAVGVAHAWYVWDATTEPTHLLLRICFFFAVALFYGTVLTEIHKERHRAEKGFSWAAMLRGEVAKRTVELEQLYHEARAANRVKDDFVASMSHELRTPIHIVVGYAEMLVSGGNGGTVTDPAELGRRIRRAALQLQRLVDGVLDLGRAEGGRQALALEPIPLNTFMEVVRGRERPAPAAGVRVLWRITSGLPTIATDPQKLGVVLDNLISNALKFTETGQITIGVEDAAARERVVFRVEDTGCGIATDALDHIFEPFHGTEPAPDGHPRGVGLGLAIVKRYVDLLEGTIRVRSTVGAGSCFEFEMPYHHPAGLQDQDQRAA